MICYLSWFIQEQFLCINNSLGSPFVVSEIGTISLNPMQTHINLAEFNVMLNSLSLFSSVTTSQERKSIHLN